MSDINKNNGIKKDEDLTKTEKVEIKDSPNSEDGKDVLVAVSELEGLDKTGDDKTIEKVVIEDKITSADKDFEDELEKNKKEIEDMINSSKNSDFKIDKKELSAIDLNFAPKAGLRPIELPRADGSLPGEPLKVNPDEKSDKEAKTPDEPKVEQHLVPEYDLIFDSALNSPFSDEQIAFIKSKKMVYVTTGNAEDIAAKKDVLETYAGKRKIAYKKAAPFMQRNRKVIQAFGFIAFMVILTSILAFTFKTQIAAFYLNKYITDNSLPIKSFEVIEFNTKFVELRNIASSDGSWTMASLRMDYENAQVKEGYINSLKIKGFSSKYTTIFDMLQGAGFRNLTGGKQATIRTISIDGTTDFGFAKVKFSTNKTQLKNDVFVSEMPVSVTSDLINFDGKLKFSGNYQEANVIVEVEKGKIKSFHGITPEITSGVFTFKKGKEKIEIIDLSLNGKTSEKTTLLFNAKATPSPTKGFDISSDLKIEEKLNSTDKKTTTIKADANSSVLEGNPFGFKGKLPLKLKISGYKDDSFSVNNIIANLDGTIACINHKCTYRLASPSKVSVDSFGFNHIKNKLTFEESPTNFVVAPDNSPLISVKDDNTIDYSFNLSETLFKGSYVSGFTIKAIESDLGLMNVKGNFNPTNLTNEININTDGGYYSDNSFGIAGIRSSFFMKSGSIPNVKLSADEIHLIGKEKLLPVFNGELTLNPASANEYNYKLIMQSLNRDMVVNVAGAYNIDEDTGTYILNIPKITFVDGGAQIANISPHYAYFLGRLNGSATVSGKGIINNGNYDGTIKLMVENATFNWGKVKFNNLSGVIGFKSFYPLTTDGEQTMYASMIDIGYPVYDNTLSFRINGNDRIIVDRIESTFAKGSILLREKSFIPFNLSGGVLNVDIKNIDLPDLVSSLKISGLSLNGKADGKLQLYISKGFIYTDGSIETTEKGGLLKYDYDEYEFDDEEMKAQLAPLRDFSYDHILAKIKGRPGNDRNDSYTIDLELEGINPEINTDGIGSVLKIDLQSDFSKLIKTKPILTPISDEVVKAMRLFSEQQ